MGNQVLLGINVCFLFCVVISFLSGLKKGAYKSIYQIITRNILYIVLWFLFDMLVAQIMAYDLSSFNINLSFGESTVLVKNGNDFLQLFIRDLYKLEESFDVTTLELYSFMYGTIAIVIKILLLLIVWLLNITVIRFIFFIIWLIIKPNYKKKKQEGIKINPLSRITGALVSTLSCLVFYFLFSIFFSGIVSLTDTLLTVTDGVIAESNSGGETSYSFRVKEVGSEKESYSYIRTLPQFSNLYFQETLDVISNYRDNVYFIKVFDLVKVEETPVDLYFFDEILQIKYDIEIDGKTKTEKVKIRKELESVKNIVNVIVENKEATSSKNFLEAISTLSDEQVTLITNNLKNLKFLEVTINLGCEFVTVSPVIKEGLDKMGQEVNVEEVVNVIRNSDLLPQIESTIKAASGVMQLVTDYSKEHADENGNVNIDIVTLLTTSDEAKVQGILDSVSGVTLLDDLSSILIALGTNSQQFKNLTKVTPTITYKDTFIIDDLTTSITGDINSYELVDIDGYWHINGFNTNKEVEYINITFDDIKLTSDIKKLGPIFKSLKTLGITSTTYFKDTNKLFELLKNEEVFTKEQIDVLCNNLFDISIVSTILGQATPILDSFIPKELSEFISLKGHSIQANDLSSILKLAQLASISGILGGENPDMAKFFNDYKDDVLDLLYESDILKKNINGIIKMAINGTGDLIDGEVLTNYDFSKEENKVELQKLFDIAGGLLDSETGVFVEGKLDQNKLLEYIVENKEKIVSSNLICDVFASTIIKQSQEGSLKDVISCTLPIEGNWRGEDGELNKLLTCLELMFTTDGVLQIDINNLNIDSMVAKISDKASQDAICASRVISDTAIMYIKKMEKTPENPDGIIVINLDDENKWYDGSHGDGELRKLLITLAKLEITSFESIDANSIISKLNEDVINSICDSVILSNTIVGVLDDYKYNPETKEGMIVIDGVTDWYSENGELRKLLNAFITLGIDDINGLDANKVIQSLNDSSINAICDSKVLTDTVVKVLRDNDTTNGGQIVVSSDITDWNGPTGELRKLLKAFISLNITDINTINANKVIETLDDEKIELICDSKVLTDTIVKVLHDNDTSNGGQIVVSDDITDWNGPTGELRKLLKAFISLNITDINTINANKVIETLDDAKIELICDSKVLTDTIVKVLHDNDTTNGGQIVVSDDITDWNGTNGELRKLLKAFISLNITDVNTINANKVIETLDDEKIELICDSKVLTDTIVKVLHDNDTSNNGQLVVSNDITDWNGPTGELRKLLKAFIALEIKDINAVSANSVISTLNDEKIELICDSKVLTDTIVKVLHDNDTTKGGQIVVSDDITDWNGTNGELRKLLKAFIALEIKDINAVSANSVISTLKAKPSTIDLISDSVVLTDTICKVLDDNSTNKGGKIVLEDVDLKANGNDELKKLLTCFTKVEIESIESIDADKLTEELDNEEFIDAVCVSKVMTNTLVHNLYDGTSMLYQPIEGEVTWTDTYEGGVRSDGELRKVLRGVNQLLLKSDNTKYKFSELTSNIVINKLNDNIFIDYASESIVLSKTVGKNVNSYAYDEITNPSGQIYVKDNITWEGEGGELKKFVSGIKVLFPGDIDLDMIDVDMILKLDEAEVKTLTTSDVLEETIRQQLLKQNPDGNGNIQVKSEFISDKGKLETELNKLIAACNIVLDDGSGNVSIKNNFEFDTVLEKTDEQIDIVFASLIIKETIDKSIYDLVETGSLKDTLELDGNNEEEKMQFVRDDSRTLVKTFMDLNSNGIDYKELNFTALSAKLNDDNDSDDLAWTLVQSNIITHSLPKLMKKIVDGTTLSEEKKNTVNYNLSKEEWRGPVNSDGTLQKDHNNPGEAAKLFRVLNVINSFDGSQSYSDKNTITQPLYKINASKVVRGLLVSYIEELTDSISSWRYPTETWKDLNIQEMDKEIDIIGDVVIQKDVISISSTKGLRDAKIKELRSLMRIIVPSRIFNLNGIKTPMVTGLNSLIGTNVKESDLGEITRTSTYDPLLTDDENETNYQDAWFEEIDDLMHAVHKMNLEANPSYLGIEKIAFVDSCNKSVIMEGAIIIVISCLGVTANESCPSDLLDYKYTYSSLKAALVKPLLPQAEIDGQIRTICEAMITDETTFRNNLSM